MADTFNKVEDFKKMIKRVHNHSMTIQGGIIFGFDEDKPDIFDSLNCVKHSDYQICFVGHVHKPLIVDDSGLNISPLPDQVTEIRNERKYIINPGALGVPEKPVRYGIFDMEKQNYISVKVAK